MMDPEVCKVFMDETSEILAGLEKAIANHDLEQVHRLAHTLKGNAAQFGFPDMSQASKEIEFLAKGILAKEIKLSVENGALFVIQLERIKELWQKLKS